MEWVNERPRLNCPGCFTYIGSGIGKGRQQTEGGLFLAVANVLLLLVCLLLLLLPSLVHGNHDNREGERNRK